ncbi:MAG: hypothetical protein ACK518_04245 [bacterium]|jgi:hypothetical protein
MNANLEFKKRVMEHIKNPVFDKPIQERIYGQLPNVKIITKIRHNG